MDPKLTAEKARKDTARADFKGRALRYGYAISVYLHTLDDIREEVLQWKWPSRERIGIASVDARLYEALKAEGLELRDLHPPDDQRTPLLPRGAPRSTQT